MIALRHFRREDAPSLRSQLYPDMTADEILDMIAAWNSCAYQGHFFEMFAILSDGRVVGCASLYERSKSMASAGAEIFRDERKKGFAAEALSLLAAYAAEKGYRILLDQVRADNQASVRLHEKLGFESDGALYRNRKNHEVFLYVKAL